MPDEEKPILGHFATYRSSPDATDNAGRHVTEFGHVPWGMARPSQSSRAKQFTDIKQLLLYSWLTATLD